MNCGALEKEIDFVFFVFMVKEVLCENKKG